MNNRFLLALFLLLGISVRASVIEIATITVTNSAGTTNGQTVTVNGSVRTWTNSVFIPASQILTNNSAGGAAANMSAQFVATGFPGLTNTAFTATSISLSTTNGGHVIVTLSAGWGTVTYETNTYQRQWALDLPIDPYPAAQRTNLASALGAAINSSYNTNPISGAALSISVGQVTNALGGAPIITNAISGNAATSTHTTNFWGTIFGTNLSFAPVVNSSAPTNIIIDCKGSIYQKLVATNNVNIQFITNGPGGISLKIFPNGLDRTLTIPTNWVLLDTNNWRLSGSLWARTITNASNGSGPRWFWISMVLDDPTCVQTNVVANATESP